MKNFKEEIEAMKAQIAALENNLVCGCGCEEQGKAVTPKQESTVVFTKEELITFATKLMDRTIEACKSAVNNVEFESDYICEVSLNGNNQIEVEIDNGVIRDSVLDEIDNTIETDEDSVEDEVDYILSDMLNEKQN